MKVTLPLTDVGPIEYDATANALTFALADALRVAEGFQAAAKEIGHDINGLPVEPLDVHR